MKLSKKLGIQSFVYIVLLILQLFSYKCRAQYDSSSVASDFNPNVISILDTLLKYKTMEAKDYPIVFKLKPRNDSIVLVASLIDTAKLYLVLSLQENDSLLGFTNYKGHLLLLYGEDPKSYFRNIEPDDADGLRYVALAKNRLSKIINEEDSVISIFSSPFYHPLVIVHVIREDTLVYKYSFRDYGILE